MVYARKRYKRTRKTYPKRRFYKKYRGSRFNRRGIKVHYFKRTVVSVSTDITNSGFQACIAGELNNTLSELPNYTEFTDLYDSYKICAIKKKFVFNRNSAAVGTAGYEIPQLITVNDFNQSSTVLASESEALQYASYKSVPMTRPITRYFRPCQLFTATGVVNAVKSRWNPTANVAIEHVGLKHAYMTFNTSTGITLGQVKTYTTFYLACRTPK